MVVVTTNREGKGMKKMAEKALKWGVYSVLAAVWLCLGMWGMLVLCSMIQGD
jgi:hypothetical protein